MGLSVDFKLSLIVLSPRDSVFEMQNSEKHDSVKPKMVDATAGNVNSYSNWTSTLLRQKKRDYWLRISQKNARVRFTQYKLRKD